MLLTSLLASSQRALITPSVVYGRHGAIVAFGELPSLSEEEFKALAGIWRCRLQLDGHNDELAMSLHLAPPEFSAHGHAHWRRCGRVSPMEENLTEGIFDATGWSSARWSATRLVKAGEVGDDQLCCTLHMGNVRLEGRGTRTGLRCAAFTGEVLFEGDDEDLGGRRQGEACGTFLMGLLLPIKTDAGVLEEVYRDRIIEHAPFAGDMTALLDFDDEGLFGELRDACDAGIEEACDAVSREEEAKRAWLARLEDGRAGPGACVAEEETRG